MRLTGLSLRQLQLPPVVVYLDVSPPPANLRRDHLLFFPTILDHVFFVSDALYHQFKAFSETIQRLNRLLVFPETILASVSEKTSKESNGSMLAGKFFQTSNFRWRDYNEKNS